MKLPENETCADCVHCSSCTVMFGVNEKNTECDFFPNRFKKCNLTKHDKLMLWHEISRREIDKKWGY